MKILSSVQTFLEKFCRGKKVWIAYSGGIDSHVLLDCCVLLRSHIDFKLSAIHVNHHLSLHADLWESYCKKICAEYAVEFSVRHIAVKSSPNESLEETARDLRYQALAEVMNDDNFLLTAHHEDDQAETVLLQLMRGSGTAGLAAMPSIKRFAAGWHARPLLTLSRQDVRDYAEDKKLYWVEDESNKHLRLRRNFVRHAVMPLLRQHVPAVSKNIARTAQHCAQIEDLLEGQSSEKLPALCGSKPQTLSIAKLNQLSEAQQILTLRAWIKQSGKRLPSTKKIAAIRTAVLNARPDRMPCVRFGNAEIRRHKDDLHVIDAKATQPILWEYLWDGRDYLILPEIGVLHCKKNMGEGIKLSSDAIIRFRRGGEKIFMNNKHHTLKNCLQTWEVPTWERNRLPLIYCGDQLAVVVGYFIDVRFSAKKNEPAFVFELKPF